MNPSVRLILQVHIPGIESYEIGDEIWQQSLAEAIEAESDAIAMAAGAELVPDLSEASRADLRARVIAEMTDALTVPGDRYTAPDGVFCSLTEESAVDGSRGEGRLSGGDQSDYRARDPVRSSAARCGGAFRARPLAVSCCARGTTVVSRAFPGARAERSDGLVHRPSASDDAGRDQEMASAEVPQRVRARWPHAWRRLEAAASA